MDGDLAVFLPNFGAAIVVVRPGKMIASGPAKIGGKMICVKGDESKVIVPGCTYVTAQHTIPGVGKLSIKQLGSDQPAKTTKTGGKEVLLKGGTFTAAFDVLVPAQQPAPPSAPIPDATPQYSGSGNFVPANATVKAS